MLKLCVNFKQVISLTTKLEILIEQIEHICDHPNTINILTQNDLRDRPKIYLSIASKD